MIIVGNGAFAQQISTNSPSVQQKKWSFSPTALLFNYHKPIAVVPAGFYCSQLGFFCRKEWRFESATGIPFRFRLGSLQYNDWLEGKSNAGILPVK